MSLRREAWLVLFRILALYVKSVPPPPKELSLMTN